MSRTHRRSGVKGHWTDGDPTTHPMNLCSTVTRNPGFSKSLSGIIKRSGITRLVERDLIILRTFRILQNDRSCPYCLSTVRPVMRDKDTGPPITIGPVTSLSHRMSCVVVSSAIIGSPQSHAESLCRKRWELDRK